MCGTNTPHPPGPETGTGWSNCWEDGAVPVVVMPIMTLFCAFHLLCCSLLQYLQCTDPLDTPHYDQFGTSCLRPARVYSEQHCSVPEMVDGSLLIPPRPTAVDRTRLLTPRQCRALQDVLFMEPDADPTGENGYRELKDLLVDLDQGITDGDVKVSLLPLRDRSNGIVNVPSEVRCGMGVRCGAVCDRTHHSTSEHITA